MNRDFASREAQRPAYLIHGTISKTGKFQLKAAHPETGSLIWKDRSADLKFLN